jgi:predicted restriction endonuclease
LTLRNYSQQCALCDIGKAGILVSAHIARWADDPDARGNLANLICMCKFHDTLFEDGYFSLSDDYRILKRTVQGGMLALLLGATNTFRQPVAYPPAREFLQKHRLRAGF